MRYDAEHKERTRARVLAQASRALRAEGPHKLGVADVMSRAGLTHGGFYAHFDSKEELVSAAIETAFDDSRRMFEAGGTGGEPCATLVGYIDGYLSMRHCDSRERGCPLPAMAGDLARMSHEARVRYSAGVHRLTDRLQGLMDAAGVEDAEAAAPSVVAEMVGAMLLARTAPDEAEAERLLGASRSALSKRLGLKAASSAVTTGRC